MERSHLLLPKRLSLMALLVLAVSCASPGATTSAPAPIASADLTGPWQLVVDDSAIANKDNVVRTYHAFTKYPGNPVVVADQPWEGILQIYGTVLPNESGTAGRPATGYRMWYESMGKPKGRGPNTILYATSDDGIHWDKPALGIREWNGSTANNMFIPRQTANGMASIIYTPWDPDPARRYKIINFEGDGYSAAYSPDGIHLTDLPNNPVFTKGGDVGQFLWDPFARRYVGYVKNHVEVNGLKRRAVARIATDDISRWPDPQLILAPDSVDDRWAHGAQRTHFYGLSAFAYQSMYLGFLWIFRATEPEGYTRGPVYSELVSSHDGIHWVREEGDRPAILGLGAPGEWDCGQLYTATQPLLVGDTLRLYYGAANREHGTRLRDTTSSIGLATLRRDGFASLDATRSVGTITTKRLEHAGGRLHVNYRAAPGGSLKVEVLDARGQVLEGYSRDACEPLQGDSIDAVVSWGERKRLPERQRIRLRFILQAAALYSFRAGDKLIVVDEALAPALSRPAASTTRAGILYQPEAPARDDSR